MTAAEHRISPAVKFLVSTRGLSSIGNTLTTFALDVWVFRQTGSYAVFAMLAVLAYLPVLLFAPLAGVMTDRIDKKKLLIAADVISGVAVLSALALYTADALAVPAVAATIFVLSVAGEMRWSSMSALFSQIVPEEQLGRVNGIQQAFRGVNVMLAPLLGAVGLDLLGLPALLTLDVLGYLLGVAGFLVIRVPSRAPSADEAPRSGFWNEITFGFRWVWEQPALRRLLAFFMLVNIGVSVFTVSFSPYLLSFSANNVLGVCLSLLGAGAFLSGVLLGRWSTKEDHDSRIVVGTLVFGLAMLLWGVCRHPVALGLVAFGIGVIETIIMASSQTQWQTHVPQEIQGKVFAVRTVLSYGLAPLAVLGSVPVADQLFRPILVDAGSVAAGIWGAAPAGSIGMLVSALGVCVSACAALLLARGGLRMTRPGGVTDARPPVAMAE